MKKTLLLLVLLCSIADLVHAQLRKQSPPRTAPAPSAIVTAKKYPSLLWEITGHGLKKPSYLFGTMHVSNKLAFHLGDSFYHAIRSAEVVALETNPETWQDDYSTSTFYAARNGNTGPFERSRRGGGGWNDRMRITSFAIDQYEEPVKAALAVEPSMINGMLYRTYGSGNDDFEEDTFLDMYIFQVGKKLGKRLSGVENFQASEKLVMEAYRDMMLDQNRKRRSYDMEGRTNPKRVEDAYRRGDLDLLDSLEALSVQSDAFQEKFLYKRNEIQANSIDSIIRKQALFVGVGAAHLPGRRGVIEMLRAMGYRLRPVMMDDRNSVQKETIDKMRLENNFVVQSAADGFYKVSVPGSKLYKFTEIPGMDVQQYADLVNGAYYVITRVKTNSMELGHTPEQVYRKVDSLLYENIPGKLLKKTTVTKNGYKGFDIVTRTRRGDQQRYEVFVTPFEVVVFKMSGNGEYATTGTEADRFFNSIQLKEYGAPQWVSWQPETGGFSVQLPHEPALLKDQFEQKRLEYHAWDKQDGNSYLVMKVSLHNYTYIEEDSFELNLMDESYAFSAFVKKRQTKKFMVQNGYPAMECKYLHKDGSFSTVRYIIRGGIYYVALARYKQENANVRRFLESFSIKPFIYPAPVLRTDTSMHYTVQSPVFPETKKEEQGMQEIYNMVYNEMEDDLDLRNEAMFVGNDTIGEKVLVSYAPLSEYGYWKDTTVFWNRRLYKEWDEDSTYVIRFKRSWNSPGGDLQTREVHYTDTGSSRLLMVKSFYRNGHLFTLSTITDTLSKQGPFLQQFFTTFTPADTLKGVSAFTRKTDQFVKDLFSKDSAVAKKASKAKYWARFDSTNVGLLQRVIDSLHWGMRDYLSTKGHFIGLLSDIKEPSVVPYLKQLYARVKDTADLQQNILGALTEHQTKEAFLAFKELLLQEPPIIDDGSYTSRTRTFSYTRGGGREVTHSSSSEMWDYVYDSLSLAKVLFPDVLQLMTVDDYEEDITELLKTMVDSGQLKAKDYESYFSKLYLDGKIALKKQVARQDKGKIEKMERKDRKSQLLLYGAGDDEDEDEESDKGNDDLDTYAALLLPFRDKNPGVQAFFEQLMKVQDRQLVYNTMLLLLRHQQPVPDSLFTKYAKLDKYRSTLYEDLKDLKLLNKFPAQYKTQAEITKSQLIENMDNYKKLDTLVLLDKLPVTYGGQKGYVYFYKYRKMRDDASWQVASVGMQPEKPGEIDVDDYSFFSKGEHKLEPDVPVREQLEKMLKEMLYAKRSSAQGFYEARNYNLYKGYMSEAVKRGRFRE